MKNCSTQKLYGFKYGTFIYVFVEKFRNFPDHFYFFHRTIYFFHRNIETILIHLNHEVYDQCGLIFFKIFFRFTMKKSMSSN